MRETRNFNLRKPDREDYYSVVDQMNYNTDIIDATMSAFTKKGPQGDREENHVAVFSADGNVKDSGLPLGALSIMRDKIAVLEAQTRSPIRTNRFMVSLETLDDVDVSGTWNEEFGRAEC